MCLPETRGLYLVVQSCYFLLTGCGQQEGVHLGLQCVVHFYVNVIAGSLLLVIRVHTIKEYSTFSFSSMWIYRISSR